MKELVETEKTYADNLKVIVKMFLNPLRNRPQNETGVTIITPQQTKFLFSNIEVILEMNTKFHDLLRERLEKWSDHQKIGDVFVSMSETFKLYTEYINNFNNSLATYEECKKNPGNTLK